MVLKHNPWFPLLVISISQNYIQGCINFAKKKYHMAHMCWVRTLCFMFHPTHARIRVQGFSFLSRPNSWPKPSPRSHKLTLTNQMVLMTINLNRFVTTSAGYTARISLKPHKSFLSLYNFFSVQVRSYLILSL